MGMMKKLGYLVFFGVACGAALAQEAKQSHIVLAPSEVKWGEPPPVLEKGASFAVVSGDPSKEGGLYVIRLKMPEGYKIAPHWHPKDEHVTVLSGSLALGMGEKFDKASMKTVAAGGYGLMPAEMRHFAMATTAATIQVDGEGPFALTYVNPADDPSKRAPGK
jgi:quercetin dioxygenase-like cupin family protein